MSDKQSTAKKNSKQDTQSIAEKLEETFASYRNGTSEKKFRKHIKKASKILSEAIHVPSKAAPEEKTTVKKAAAKKVAVKKNASKKAAAKKTGKKAKQATAS